MSRQKNQEIVFKALADSRRRAILDLLKTEPMTTGEICGRFPHLDRCTVMQHLGVLEKAELVIVRRVGRLRWNYLNAVPIREIYDRWISQYADYPVQLLSQLKGDLETSTR